MKYNPIMTSLTEEVGVGYERMRWSEAFAPLLMTIIMINWKKKKEVNASANHCASRQAGRHLARPHHEAITGQKVQFLAD